MCDPSRTSPMWTSLGQALTVRIVEVSVFQRLEPGLILLGGMTINVQHKTLARHTTGATLL